MSINICLKFQLDLFLKSVLFHSLQSSNRGILYRRLKDFTAAIEDLVQAVELSEEEDKEVSAQTEARKEKDGPGSVQEEAQFQLVLTYNDFAVQCFSRGLYAEATLLLNKAIEEEKGQAGLYLNRGGETWLSSSVSATMNLTVLCCCRAEQSC